MNELEKPEIPEQVRDLQLLREHAGTRTRTVDEHRFSVERSSFRLQLFTGPGLRPVAVATQTGSEGASPMNRAERFVEAVWQRLCPDETQPPIFIAHQLLMGEDFGFAHYGFTVTGPHAVASPPKWGPHLRPIELAALIWLSSPDLNGDPACMPAGTPRWRRLFRQVVPRRAGLSCCWYHRVDWATASAAAITALARADANDFAPDPDEERDDPEHERMFATLKALRGAGLDTETLEAARSLFLDPIKPESPENDWPYINGRHRVQAMLDAGVRRTVIGRWEEPDGDQ